MLRVIRGISYGANPGQVLDIYAHKDVRSRPVVLFWPGGSWTADYRTSAVFIGRVLAKMGYVVIVPSYRLYPEIKFPVFIEDGARAVAWTAHHIRSYGGDPDHIALMGHSAGAHIAALLALDHSYLNSFDVPIESIRALIGLSGPYNFTPRPELAPIFAGSNRKLWNPVDQVRADVPPTMLVHGGRDRIVEPENSRDLHDRLQKIGSYVELYLYRPLKHFGPIALLAIAGSPVHRRVREFLGRNL